MFHINENTEETTDSSRHDVCFSLDDNNNIADINLRPDTTNPIEAKEPTAIENSKHKFSVTKITSLDTDLVKPVQLFDESHLLMPLDDPLPEPKNYKISSDINEVIRSRPTLLELRNQTYSNNHENNGLTKKRVNSNSLDLNELEVITKTRSTNKTNNEKNSKTKNAGHDVIKFGWIKGVLIRCILNIFGVMIFLRVSWIVGHVGIGMMTLIILLATLVTLITALSTSAIATNGEVRGGGAYYLISRSLGPEFGGAIGLVFSFANAVAAAMYVIGFAETLVNLLNEKGYTIIDGAINDVRIIGLITNAAMLIIALIGMKWESKVQSLLLLILLIAFLNFIIGSFIPNNEKRAKGFVGYNLKHSKFCQVDVFKENFLPSDESSQSFAHIFGVFFPAVTGILAGANISGNLKNPETAIPKGTLLSIIITSAIYVLFSWICGATVIREATGNLTDFANGTFAVCKSANGSCKLGLMNDYRVMEMVSVFSPIIIAGIFSASLSSALASLVSAPKVFQAVCEDKIFPKIEYFAKGHGKDNEPFRGYLLAFFISNVFIGIGELNEIAPIISNFFLMSYALVNFSCFDASLAQNPGFRPSFKYYNKWVSLLGAILCISVMFLIKWWAALVSFIAIIGIHYIVKQSKPNINWGSSSQAHIFRRSLDYSLKLIDIEEHVKNFRPNFLVLTGLPTNRSALCDFTSSIAKSRSLMVCANVILTSNDGNNNDKNIYTWFRKRKIKSFYSEINSSTFRIGINSLMQSIGIGKLKPNTIMIGFKNNWLTDRQENVFEYYEIINDAFNLNYGVCILRLDGGLDFSGLLGDVNYEQNSTSESEFSDYSDSEIKTHKVDSKKKTNIEYLISKQNKKNLNNINQNGNQNNTNNFTQSTYLTRENSESTLSAKRITKSINNISNEVNTSYYKKSTDLIKLKNTKINQGVLQSLNIFYRKYQYGFVDVWWLYDDGGLTILLPYLLLQKKYWKKCKLRIFIQTKNQSPDISEEQQKMADLLSKFRIQFHDLIVFSTSDKKPQQSNLLLYQKLIADWRLKPGETSDQFPWKISDTMLKQNQERINHYIRLRELMNTISVPSKSATCAGLYMSYLDLISYQMPPVLLVRGNQSQVLTYYS